MSFIDALLSVLNVLLIAGSPVFVLIYSIIFAFVLFLVFLGFTFGSVEMETYGEDGLIRTFWEGVAYWIGWLVLSILTAATITTCWSAMQAGNILYW